MRAPKQTIRVLFADRDEEFRRNTAEALSRCGRIELIAAVGDGETALAIAREKQPDAVVLDAMLPRLDGLTVAAILKKECPQIDVLLMSVFLSQRFSQECHYLQVADILQKPLLPQSVAAHTLLCLDSKTQRLERIAERNWKKDLAKLMHRTGIRQGTKGYLYVGNSILYDLMHEGASCSITKQIYPELSRKYHTEKVNIERVIRSAIETAYKKGDIEWLSKYFGAPSEWKTGRPTNAAFIARAAELLRQEDIEKIL